MSKQSDAKITQLWQKKPVWPTCANCQSFKFDVVETKVAWGNQIYKEEKNLRCGRGTFKVGRMDTCKMHEPVDSPEMVADKSRAEVHSRIIAAM